MTRKTRTPPQPCPCRRPIAPRRRPQLTWHHAVAVEKEKKRSKRKRELEELCRTKRKRELEENQAWLENYISSLE